MKTKNVSLIIFYDEENRILLQDRRNMSKFGEEWGFFGGKIEEGEAKEEALVRETKEELTFDLTDYEFLTKKEGKVSDDRYLVAQVFIARLKNNLSKFEQKEGCGMNLFSIDEARKLKISGVDQEILNAVEVFLEKK